MWELPEEVILSAGHSEGITPLNAFDNSLSDAGVADFNLIRVSSIIPPGAKIVKLPVGTMLASRRSFFPGMFVPTVYEYVVSEQRGEVIAVAIGAGIPVDKKRNGVIAEYKCIGEKYEAEKMVEKMVREMFKQRKTILKEIKIVSAQHCVKKIGCAVAVALLLKERTSFPFSHGGHGKKHNVLKIL